MTTKNILIIGGTGMLGKPVAMQLHNDEFNISVLSRNIFDARIKLPGYLNIIEGNIHDYDSLLPAFEKTSAIHINLPEEYSHAHVSHTEKKGLENIIRAAKEYKIQKITFISNFKMNKTDPAGENEKPTPFFEKILKESDIQYVNFQPTLFMENLPKIIHKGEVYIFKNNTKKYAWLSANDYAQMVSKALFTNVANNKTIGILGPELLTIEEAVVNYCKLTEQEINIIDVSPFKQKISTIWPFKGELKKMETINNFFLKTDETDKSENILGKAGTTLEEWVDIHNSTSKPNL